MDRQVGGQSGNVNALKNGRRSSRPGTVLARLGKRYCQCYQDVLRLRRGVETLLKRHGGELTLLQGARVQTLCRLELNARLAELSIRTTPDMPTAELRALRSLIGQWSAQRDNALASLLDGNGTAHGSPWDVLLEPQDHPAAAAGNALGPP
jgi:hypothetical protein